MKRFSIACGFMLVCGMAAAAQAQVVTTYLPPAPIAFAAPPVIVAPAPAVTYYSAPVYAPVVYPRRYVVPAPVVVRPRAYAVRPKVYVRGQPVRNTLRAVTP